MITPRTTPMAPALEAELLHRCRLGDMPARHRLTERYLPLAVRVAGRFRRKGPELEDLVQVAALAVFRATESWRPTEPIIPFEAWAWMMALRDVQRTVYCEQPHHLVRVPSPRSCRMPSAATLERHQQLRATLSRRVDASERRGVGPGVGPGVESKQLPLGRVHSGEFDFDEFDKLRAILAELDEQDRDIVMRRAAGEPLATVGRRYGRGKKWARNAERRILNHLQARWVDTSRPMEPIDRPPCALSEVWPIEGYGPPSGWMNVLNGAIQPPDGWPDIQSWMAAVKAWCADHPGSLSRLAEALSIHRSVVSVWLAAKKWPNQTRVDQMAAWLAEQTDWAAAPAA